MNHVYLERHNDKDNLHRFYQMFVTPGLFDDWSLIKEWGRFAGYGEEAMVRHPTRSYRRWE
ncbi:MAG: WGR domain-containing protein [Methylomonas lenta]|nr:WGR domain-containing protein [Methylomonas lenta]